MGDPLSEIGPGPAPIEGDPLGDAFGPAESYGDPLADIGPGQPSAGSVSYTESALRGAAQGVLFNTADELTGLSEALAHKANGDTQSFSEIYTRSRDEARAKYAAAEKANPKTFMASGLAAGLALPGAGWLAGGKTLGAAVRAGAAAGALGGFGGAEGDVKEQLAQTAVGAGVGAAVGGTLHGVVKGVSALLGPKASTAVINDLPELAPKAHKILDSIPDNLDEAIKGQDPLFMQYQLKLNKAPETVEAAFTRTEGKQNSRAAKIMERAVDNLEDFQKNMSQFSPDMQKKLYAEYRNTQAFLQAARETKSEFMNKLRVNESDPVQGFMSWLRPANFNAQRVDAKYGSDFTGSIMGAIEAENKLASGARPFLQKALDVESKMYTAMAEANKRTPSKYNNFDDFSRDVYQRVTQGKYKKGSVEEDIVNYFKTAKDALNKEYGLNIQEFQPYGKQSVYLPRSMMDTDTMRLKLDRAADRLFDGNMSDKEQKHFWDGMRYLGKEYGLELGPDSTRQEVKQFITNQLVRKSEERGATKTLEASAAFGRDHDIPPYLVNRDIPQMMANYINGNMKAGLYQVPMARLSAQIESARTLGMPKTAEYFQNIYENLMGAPSATKARFQEKASQWRLIGQRTMDDAKTPIGKMQGFMQRMAPEFVPWSMGNMYHNLLNLNPYSAMRNLTQPVMSGSTDIASIAGEPYAAKITALSFKDLMTKGWKGADPNVIGLANEGPMKSPSTEAIVQGLKESGIPDAFVKGLRGYDKFAQNLMHLYSEADKVNRTWTMHMADRVLADVQKGNPKALKLLAEIPVGIRSSIERGLSSGKVEQARDLLRQHYNIKHQYSYTNADMSRLGREYGSMLTAFTKFPLTLASDIEQEVYKKGLGAAFPMVRKYLFPLAALSAGDYMLKDKREDLPPTAKLFFGDKLRDISPVLGVMVQPPPLLKAGYDMAKEGVKTVTDLPELEPEEMPARIQQAGGKILNAAAPFIPAYGMYNATTKRLQRAGVLDKPED